MLGAIPGLLLLNSALGWGAWKRWRVLRSRSTRTVTARLDELALVGIAVAFLLFADTVILTSALDRHHAHPLVLAAAYLFIAAVAVLGGSAQIAKRVTVAQDRSLRRQMGLPVARRLLRPRTIALIYLGLGLVVAFVAGLVASALQGPLYGQAATQHAVHQDVILIIAVLIVFFLAGSVHAYAQWTRRRADKRRVEQAEAHIRGDDPLQYLSSVWAPDLLTYWLDAWREALARPLPDRYAELRQLPRTYAAAAVTFIVACYLVPAWLIVVASHPAHTAPASDPAGVNTAAAVLVDVAFVLVAIIGLPYAIHIGRALLAPRRGQEPA